MGRFHFPAWLHPFLQRDRMPSHRGETRGQDPADQGTELALEMRLAADMPPIRRELATTGFGDPAD
ncbi:hypothetical protein [Eleftheria terrae]|uniref:hypothetical protein n=1 Tax=Eleftheria terrae TaxID=1597781 RepID=UPI00263B07C3|nr:hypothetical protein [Eleftheria terrae]WKB51296.1 hypothetical protein N7L95_15950 [Eleftheria terrae]